MAKVNLEELLGGLQEASQVVLSIQERQHINTISKYFDKDGTPITQKFRIGDRDIEVPLYILADHSSVGLDKLDIEFQARLLPGNTTNHQHSKRIYYPSFKDRNKRVMTNTNIRLVTSQLMVTVLTRKVLLKSVYILRKIINPSGFSISRYVNSENG